MMRKSICLFLFVAVLAVAGTASAATSLWKGGTGDWGTASNWVSTGPPSATGSTYCFSSAAGTNVITVSTSATNLVLITGRGAAGVPTNVTVSGPQYNTLHINSGVILQTGKQTYMYSTLSGSTSTLEIYGTYNGETATSSSAASFYLASGTGAVSTDTVKVYGTFNVAMVAADLGSLLIGNTGSGNGILDIYNGGIANVNAYTIGGVTSSTGHIYIQTGGYMWINGNVTSQVATDVTGHKIQQGTFDTSGTFVSATDLTSANYGYNSTLGQTWITVPEPATVALLGLGGLLLLKRKRR